MGVTVLVPTVLVLANVLGFGPDDSIADEEPSSPASADAADPGASDTTSSSSSAPTNAAGVEPDLSDAISPPSSAPQSVGGPITIKGEEGLTIENWSISNPDGACLTVVGSSDITIKNSTIGPCGSWGVFIDRSSRVTVQGSNIRTGSAEGGIYGLSSKAIAVLGNDIANSGRNPVQFDKVTGAGNRIDNNSISSNASEDMISVHKSGGTPESWLTVRDNTIRDNVGKSTSGSGIMVGDAGGSYILVQGNHLTDPGQVGIGVAGGSNVRVLDNDVKSAQFSWSNVGIYTWDQSSTGCDNIEVRGNTVDWVNESGQSNPAWDGGGCGTISGWDSNSW